MSYITMKTDVQNALTQINTSFGNSLTDEYNNDFKLPYAAFIQPVELERFKSDSFGTSYFPEARQQLRIIREVEDGMSETEAFQELYNITIELQSELTNKYFVDSEFITPLQTIHNRDKPCYESVLIITERK